MSEPQPLPVESMYEPVDRPTSVTVMAVIGILLGAMGFLCSPLALIPYFMELPAPNPVVDGMKNDNALFGWTIAATAMNWALAILLLSASIGALGLKEWARQSLIGWSIAGALLSLAQVAINIFYVFPKLQELTQGQPHAAATTAGNWIGVAMGLILGVGIPAVMLFFMTRPNVKNAFARGLRRIV